MSSINTIEQVHKFEKIVVDRLNKKGWDLKWTGGAYENYDAKGYTKKNKKCVLEIKFRKDYYYKKLLEKFKYDKLINLSNDILKIYLVIDPKATYYFWLDNITLKEIKYIDCPKTTLWEDETEKKEVYLLGEDLASYIEKDFKFSKLID